MTFLSAARVDGKGIGMKEWICRSELLSNTEFVNFWQQLRTTEALTSIIKNLHCGVKARPFRRTLCHLISGVIHSQKYWCTCRPEPDGFKPETGPVRFVGMKRKPERSPTRLKIEKIRPEQAGFGVLGAGFQLSTPSWHSVIYWNMKGVYPLWNYLENLYVHSVNC